MTDLTDFERSLILATIAQHPKYAYLVNQLASLKVERRENTGVGAYITFSKDNQEVFTNADSPQLGFTGDISVPGVPSGLGAVIDVDKGTLNHINLFTYGDEEWNGATGGAKLFPAPNK